MRRHLGNAGEKPNSGAAIQNPISPVNTNSRNASLLCPDLCSRLQNAANGGGLVGFWAGDLLLVQQKE
jgi:hypothetical protein